MPNAKLQKYLAKRINQPTVILCFRILVENALANGIDTGLTKSGIAKVFNKDNKAFGIQNFKTDYILRQTGMGDSAIIEKDDIFILSEDFLEGVAYDELQQIVIDINNHYMGVAEIRQKLYEEIKKAQILPVSERKEFIMHMLLERETEKKGQSFEVTAFAILKVYYSIRGFELNRFSTIYSNDGGIDYTSQTSIYQVTTVLSDTKFNEDIRKAPLKNRIFVYRKALKDFDYNKMENDLVSDYISAEDLENHLDYLLSKKATTNSSRVLSVILNEFEREHYL